VLLVTELYHKRLFFPAHKSEAAESWKSAENANVYL